MDQIKIGLYEGDVSKSDEANAKFVSFPSWSPGYLPLRGLLLWQNDELVNETLVGVFKRVV
ncbi:MAG: hypothetical protein O3B01_27505 [Planctomycetota bacterium]|nr:hypothetical protein [Planctomycetota bacterium]